MPEPVRPNAERRPTERAMVEEPVAVGGAACPVETIAQAYLDTTHGDADIALRCAITDALSDLLEAERRARENSRLISRGYVRSAAER
jgi:hypothetical protein